VPRFEPFRGIRFDPDQVSLAAVTSPPYDVLNAADKAALRADRPHNITWIDCPEPDGYERAGQMLREWIDEEVLVVDPEPGFYVYRMGFVDEAGRAHQTSGIIGALELMHPGHGDVLPHERTTPKDASDRLNLLRGTHANLSPVWGLSMASGLGTFAELPGTPLARWTSDDGVHHRLYRITEPGTVAAIGQAVSSSPVVIADGHHRYETSLMYRDEWRAAHGDVAGGHDLTMAFVVELAPDQLFVQAIHRLLVGAPTDLLERLGQFFDAHEPPVSDVPLTSVMDDAGALCLLDAEGRATLLRPRPDAFSGVDDLDSARLAHALAGVDPDGEITVVYQHGVDRIRARLAAGDAPAAVLLRPVSVAVIEDFAHRRRLMPPKSTFFAPKPKTGVVLRSLD
jgi:uncharacterized protein (DUF1015 family)